MLICPWDALEPQNYAQEVIIVSHLSSAEALLFCA